MKSIVVTLLICILVAFTAASQTIKIDVYDQSNSWWMAFAVRDADVDTRSVQILQADSTSWETAPFNGGGWAYYTVNSNGSPLKFPMSVRLTAINGKEITLTNIIPSFAAAVIDTLTSYNGAVVPAQPTAAPATQAPASATQTPTSDPTARPTSRPSTAATSRPATSRPIATARPTAEPTERPAATSRPTSRPTAAATSRPATAAATARPTAQATTRPATIRATTAPTTRPATARPTTPASGSGCGAPIKILVPLYMYPGSQWDTVIASASKVKTVAIINPSSGPGTGGPDSAFRSYMTKFDQAGIEMVGYVHTSYGSRSISTVKKEIDEYASKFPSVVGIFLDEVSAKDSELSYYKELYQYIMSMPGWKYDVINPGAVPTAGYLDAATQIVSFETDASKFASSSNPSYASCSNKDKFSVITYGASSSLMQSAVNTAKSKGYYGWFYATDGTLNGGTYNKLPSYYGAMAQYIADSN